VVRRYSMPEKDAWAKLRPRSVRDRHRIRVVSGYLALIAIFIAAAFFFKHKHREDLEQNWNSATATIEDVRPKEVAQINTSRGGAMLYQVEVLVMYKSDGLDQRRWIAVEQLPEVLSEAQLQAFRWKGKQCIVRWKPSDPSKVIAEVS
jgi:hypothetical protein